MSGKLSFQSHDWSKHTEKEKETIIEEIAQQLSKERPELFTKGALVGDAYLKAENLVRNAVLTRTDLAPEEHEEIVNSIIGQATSYGPLKEYFIGKDAKEVTEIMVNPSPDGTPKVFYGMRGRLHYGGTPFKDNNELTRYCQKICEDVGRPFTSDAPIVDAWLRDGSRIAVMGFKASPLGTALTIRKSPLIRPPLPLSSLVKFQMFPQFVADLMVDCIIDGHANAGIYGRTDSGKTTVARSLGEKIDTQERVIIAETSYELAMPNLPNCINLVEVTYGSEKLVTMTHLCEAINRNNPDRAIVGEVRGGEIVAASEIAESISGGFMTTGHAGGIDELRSRIPKMFYRGGMPLSREYVDGQIRSMFHFIIFVDKAWDGTRTLMSLVEVTKGGYRTIIRFDEDEFSKTKGKVRRWVYENPISQERLSRLAFRGATIRAEYEQVNEKYLYPEGGLN